MIHENPGTQKLGRLPVKIAEWINVALTSSTTTSNYN